MLRTFRRLRLGHIALALASALAVTGSLGLHPEPADALPMLEANGHSEWDGPRAPDRESHECLVCLAHRSLSILQLPGAVLQPGTAVTVCFYPRIQRFLPSPARTHAGRAPPALA